MLLVGELFNIFEINVDELDTPEDTVNELKMEDELMRVLENSDALPVLGNFSY